jgi:hypothetical protein
VRRENLFTAELNLEQSREGHRWRAAQLAGRLGAELIGGTIYELDADQLTFPFHFHHGIEEWLYADAVTRGPGGAHELCNADTEVARVLVLATSFEPAVTHYPDDGTLRVTPPGKLFREADAIASESD